MEQNFPRASINVQLNLSVMAKMPKYNNNQPNKEAIKSHACKSAGAKYNAAAKSHEKENSSSYQIKVIVIGFGMEMKSIIF